VGVHVPGTSQRGFQYPLISYAPHSTVFREALRVEQQ
jgi:hypothetical protein